MTTDVSRRRKLSTVEHILDGNIVCLVRLEGSFSVDRLRAALSRVQRKHPALRALIGEEPDGLYYEADSAPAIPLRIVPRVADDDWQRECRTELTTDFAHDQPQLRAVLLPSDSEGDLLFTTSHRICDGMSVLTIVREVLRSLHNDEELIPYEPITVRDVIGNHRPKPSWKRAVAVGLVNGLLRLLPGSRREPEALEHYVEWSAGQRLSTALKQRCKAEGVSVHAALIVALDRAMSAVFGNEKLPTWIDNQMDPRRMRFPGLESDMLFLAGGSFKVRTGQAPDVEFWARTRLVNQEMRTLIEQAIRDAPGHFHLFEMFRPPTSAQIHSIIRLNHGLRRSRRLSSFPLSNLGNIVVLDSDAPFRLKDLRLYVHSFKTRALGLITYTINGEMRFYCLSHEKCMSRSQLDALERELMALLQRHAVPEDCAGEAAACSVAIVGSPNCN
jgi:hypothetical protein